MVARAVRGVTSADVLDERRRRRALRSETRCILTPGSREQSRGGSDTPAPPAGTRSVVEPEASEGCVLEAGCGPDDEVRKSAAQRRSARTAACP